MCHGACCVHRRVWRDVCLLACMLCRFDQAEKNAGAGDVTPVTLALAVDVTLALAVHRRGASGVYATVLSHSTTHTLPSFLPLPAVHTARLRVSGSPAVICRGCDMSSFWRPPEHPSSILSTHSPLMTLIKVCTHFRKRSRWTNAQHRTSWPLCWLGGTWWSRVGGRDEETI